MNVFDMLTLRSEFEEIVLNYRIPGDRKAGTVENLEWFVENAYERNSRKKGFKRANEIAKQLIGATVS